MSGYDIIGDIHGNGAKLTALLKSLDYHLDAGGSHRHPEGRTAVFAGDLIDRGEEHREVLDTVKAMVDAGSALIVMGNHEFNAVCYATAHPDLEGLHLREHNQKNEEQHESFLRAFPDDERVEWIEWFKGLPLWLDLDGVRVVHACWHQESIDLLANVLGGNTLRNLGQWVEASDKDTKIGQAIEIILKNPEIEVTVYGLPKFFTGKTLRSEARVRWWAPEVNSIADLIDMPEGTKQENGEPYPSILDTPFRGDETSFSYLGAEPVVYGHHWRSWGPKEHLDWTPKTACVDFSAGKDGPLVAYRWSGESIIDPANYVHAFAP